MGWRAQDEISMVSWADELLPSAQVGLAGVCLSPCSALSEQHLGSAMLTALSSVPGVSLAHSQAIPVLKKCHSLCKDTDYLCRQMIHPWEGVNSTVCQGRYLLFPNRKSLCYVRSSVVETEIFQLMLGSSIPWLSGLGKGFSLVSIPCIIVY